MKYTRSIGLCALLAGASILPSVVVEDAALDAKAAIKGRTLYINTSSAGWGSQTNSLSYSSSRTTKHTYPNTLIVYGTQAYASRSTSFSPRTASGFYIDLDELSVNQALPEPPVVQLNISESDTTPGKTRVRWHID